jgi:hypothetical protein
MYITVLDFTDGKVYQHEAEPEAFEDYETWLDQKGHNVNNIQWMLHEDSGVITN